MTQEKDKIPVRVVVKKKKDHGGAHGGAWKVAYADFVTAMMALFIVLWIVGQSNQLKQMIAEYFK
ncbi:MAG TPA: flagellar motor protein MotB, partial [Thermodesulfobacteriota bacterium]|nr:flagellar motor protein MotB [Thermodesulfobacteriota bacterium]